MTVLSGGFIPFRGHTGKGFECQWWNDTFLEIPPKCKEVTQHWTYGKYESPRFHDPHLLHVATNIHVGFEDMVVWAPARVSSTFRPMFAPAKTLTLHWGTRSGEARFVGVLHSEEGIIANRKKGFFCLTLNNWGIVGYYLIHNSSMHLLRTMGWHSWKKIWNFNVCKILDNVTFASGLAMAFIRSS